MSSGSQALDWTNPRESEKRLDKCEEICRHGVPYGEIQSVCKFSGYRLLSPPGMVETNRLQAKKKTVI